MFSRITASLTLLSIVEADVCVCVCACYRMHRFTHLVIPIILKVCVLLQLIVAKRKLLLGKTHEEKQSLVLLADITSSPYFLSNVQEDIFCPKFNDYNLDQEDIITKCDPKRKYITLKKYFARYIKFIFYFFHQEVKTHKCQNPSAYLAPDNLG